MSELDFMDFESDKDCNGVGEIEDKLNEWGCRAFDRHEWIYDQCGYWQHQYCVHCRNAKYPEMARKRCGEIDAEMGEISEEEFLTANGQCPATEERFK